MPDEQTRLHVEVALQQPAGGFGGLRFSEDVDLPVHDFAALAKILSRFHDLFLEIKRQGGK